MNKSTKMMRGTLASSLLTGLLLLVISDVDAQKVDIEQTQSGTFQVQVSKGKLSLNANQAPLVQVFQEIGKQAKINFDSNIGSEEKITTRLEGVPLEEGIKQLAKNVTVFYTQGPNESSRRIERVVVLSERREGASGRGQAS